MAWFGSSDDLRRHLTRVEADTRDDGSFIIDGPVTEGIGGLEVIVHQEALYYIDGEPHVLSDDLNERNCGVTVGVF